MTIQDAIKYLKEVEVEQSRSLKEENKNAEIIIGWWVKSDSDFTDDQWGNIVGAEHTIDWHDINEQMDELAED